MAPPSSASTTTTAVGLRRSQRISLYHPSLLPLLSCRSLRQLLQAQAHLTVSSLLSDPFASSRLLKTSLSLSLPHSLLLFRHLPNPDLFSLNLLLPFSPISLFFSSLHSHSSLSPNSFTFTALLSSAARSADLTAGETAHSHALKRGFLTNPSAHVPNSLIHLYSACGLATSARQVFDEMPHRDLVSWNSLVDAYVKVGDLETAREVFERMPQRNVVSWNVMVSGYSKGRRTEMGLGLAREMWGSGVRGDVKTMVGAVTGCGRMGRGREGRSVHGRFVRCFGEEEGNLIFKTALVDMYGKCERMGDARRVFDGLKERNLVCWNAMILGYCVHGDPKDGIALFEEMVRQGENSRRGAGDNIQPDEVTFVGVLSACARGGLLDEGKKYFEQMKNLYHLTPTFAHYWCMTNLYCSLGLVEEAEQVLKSMPEEKESLIWSVLLGYCRFRGDIELGERIAKALIELEPSNGSRYALLWNVYMAAGRWEDAQNVKETMKERRVRAMPNGRLVDLNEIVHNFKVGDRSRPEIEKIYAMMDDLAVMMKLPSVATDSIDGSKE